MIVNIVLVLHSPTRPMTVALRCDVRKPTRLRAFAMRT
jgi:hypothetical protein